MTDTTQQAQKEGVGKTSLDIILRMVAQNVTPVMVGLLCAKIPLLSESTWYEITVFVLAAVGNGLNKVTPDSLWIAISTAILWFRRGIKRVHDSSDQPLQ